MACVAAPGGPFLCRSADFLRLVFQHGIPACRRELLHSVFLLVFFLSLVGEAFLCYNSLEKLSFFMKRLFQIHCYYINRKEEMSI